MENFDYRSILVDSGSIVQWSHVENDDNYDSDQDPDHDDTQLCGDSGAMSYSWRAPSSWGKGKQG